eukprot:53391-Eustigmatos_ZCMA.PRE.1
MTSCRMNGMSHVDLSGMSKLRHSGKTCRVFLMRKHEASKQQKSMYCLYDPEVAVSADSSPRPVVDHYLHDDGLIRAVQKLPALQYHPQ